jgi:hypothetical protein
VHADGVRVAGFGEIRQLAQQVVAVISRVRSRGKQGDDVILRALIADEMSKAGLLPSDLEQRLGARRLDELPSGR